MVPRLADLGKMFPKIVKDGPCKEQVLKNGEFSLLDFPIIKCWPDDGGRYITMPLVFTKNPATGKRNCGMYRMGEAIERMYLLLMQRQFPEVIDIVRRGCPRKWC